MATATETRTRIELVKAEPQHSAELGRIFYEAFKDLSDRHGFPLDFPSAAVGRQIIGMLLTRPDFYGVAALLDGQLVGSNFMAIGDPVWAVGPISVDCAYQGAGIGRKLMEDVIEHARRSQVRQVRLVQETFNTRSISLYASLGFDIKEELAFMQAAPAQKEDSTVRPLTGADVPVAGRLSVKIYGTTRQSEIAAAVKYGFSPFIRERNGRISGYWIPGLFGHGVAETEEDAVAIVGETARRLPANTARLCCPLGDSGFFRALLKSGCRTIKLATLMAMGPYERPKGGVWMPSFAY
jgi:ribosomal protein S18 acetylase RimI-like enzyme